MIAKYIPLVPVYCVLYSDVTESLDKAEVALQTFESKKQQNAPEAIITELGRALRNSLRSIEWDVEDLQVSQYVRL